MNTHEILMALEAMHPAQDGWVFMPELRAGTGYRGLAQQRVDAWAIQCWGTGGKLCRVSNRRRAFEVKVTEEDLRRELLNPDKRWYALAISHEFYFVAPKGLVNLKHLTKDDGLIEWDGAALRVVKAPRVREAMPPRWDFIAGLLRRLKRNEMK